jgi:hypothetical protein
MDELAVQLDTIVAIRKHFLIGRSGPLLVPRAQVRAPSIEGTAPSAALCEATAPSARGPARLGVGTAGHPPSFCCFWRASAASAGRLRALQVAGRRFWLVREAPKHACRARQRARTGALSRASAPRPCAAAFRHDFSDARVTALHRPNQSSRAFLANQQRRRGDHLVSPPCAAISTAFLCQATAMKAGR